MPRLPTYSSVYRLPSYGITVWRKETTEYLRRGRLLSVTLEGRDLTLIFERRLRWWHRIWHSISSLIPHPFRGPHDQN